MHYFLGVDSGGTKADFLLGDETRELVRVPYENWNVIDRHGFLRWRHVDVCPTIAALLGGSSHDVRGTKLAGLEY